MSPSMFATTDVNAERAYCMGYDAGVNGPNTTNCHFALFATPALTKEWERGKKLGDQHRQSAAEHEQAKEKP